MNNKNNSVKVFEKGVRGEKFFQKFFPPVIALFILLTSCAGGVPEDEAAGIVSELVEASLPLNEIYFGEGMPVEEDGYGAYRAVTDDAPYLTEAALREATEAVFTGSYSEYLFGMFLTGYSDDDVDGVVYARYVENGDRLSMRVAGDVEKIPAREYDMDSIVIIRTTKDTIEAEITSDDGTVVDVTARLEDAGWRLDSPTY